MINNPYNALVRRGVKGYGECHIEDIDDLSECSFGGVRYQYEADADCITCIDMEQPSDAERCCGWQVVPLDNN